jgi:hypothetical protein
MRKGNQFGEGEEYREGLAPLSVKLFPFLKILLGSPPSTTLRTGF